MVLVVDHAIFYVEIIIEENSDRKKDKNDEIRGSSKILTDKIFEIGNELFQKTFLGWILYLE